MAPGYVIALGLETAGAFGVLTAVRVMRAERRARSADLRGFLRSGSSGASTVGNAAFHPLSGKRRPRVQIVDLPVATRPPSGQTAMTVARAALHRVLVPRTADAAGGRRVSAG